LQKDDFDDQLNEVAEEIERIHLKVMKDRLRFILVRGMLPCLQRNQIVCHPSLGNGNRMADKNKDNSTDKNID
jgi:hypothetical protein